MTRTLRAIGGADATGQGLLAVALALVFCELQLLVVKYEK